MKLITLRPKKGRVGVNSSNTQLEVHMMRLQLLITLQLFFTENSSPLEKEEGQQKIRQVSRISNNLLPS